MQLGVAVGCVRLITYADLALKDKYEERRAWPPEDVVNVHHAARQGLYENTYVSARADLGDNDALQRELQAIHAVPGNKEGVVAPAPGEFGRPVT